MTTEKKTLADVQPGGRVRLGDQDAQTIEKLRAMMDHSFGGPGFVVYGTAQSIAELERRLAPDLAARQSVCPTCEKEGVFADDGSGPFDCYTCGKKAADRQPVEEVSVKKEDANNYCLILRALGMEEEGDPVAEVQALIEARDRQPVGEPVGYATFRDGRFGSWLFRTRAMAGSHDSTAVAGGPANSEIVPLFRSPAQAVDLGEMRKCSDEAVEFINHGYGGHARRKIQELLALIDGKAVGNK